MVWLLALPYTDHLPDLSSNHFQVCVAPCGVVGVVGVAGAVCMVWCGVVWCGVAGAVW